jgi:cation transport ATPase
MKRLAAARRLSQRTASVIRQNLVFAIGAMLVLVTSAAFFELPLPLAVLGHEGGTVLVVLNGLRLLNDPIRNTRPPMTATHTNRAPAEPPEQGPTPRAAATA